MIRKINRLIILLILVFFLNGCWDYQDVNNRSIVISVGVDRVDGNIQFITEIAKLKAELGKEQEKAEITNVYTDVSYGKTFEEARVDVDSQRPHPTFLGATRVVIFGTNIARESIEPYLNRINKMYDYRKTLLPVISCVSPRELLSIPVENDISVGFLIEDTINFLSKRGLALYPSIGDLLSNIALGVVGYVIPHIGIEQDSIKYIGLAVMKDSKLIDVLETKDTTGLLYLLGDNPKLTEIVPGTKNKDNILSFGTKIKDRKIKTKYEDGKIAIDINLDLSGQLKYQYYVESISDEELEKAERIIENKIKNDIETIIEKSQKVYECDIFQFAKIFRADNPKIFKEINWLEEYPKAKLNVNVKIKIINKNLADPNAKSK